MPTPTANYSFQKPEVGGEPDAWGTILNGALDAIDATIRSLANTVGSNSAQIVAVSNLASNAYTLAAAALPAASFSTASVMGHVLAGDGSGSGVDADLLDGLQGAAFLNSSNQNAGTLPEARLPGNVLRNGYPSALVNVSYAAPSGGSDGDLWFQL